MSEADGRAAGPHEPSDGAQPRSSSLLAFTYRGSASAKRGATSLPAPCTKLISHQSHLCTVRTESSRYRSDPAHHGGHELLDRGRANLLHDGAQLDAQQLQNSLDPGLTERAQAPPAPNIMTRISVQLGNEANDAAAVARAAGAVAEDARGLLGADRPEACPVGDGERLRLRSQFLRRFPLAAVPLVCQISVLNLGGAARRTHVLPFKDGDHQRLPGQERPAQPRARARTRADAQAVDETEAGKWENYVWVAKNVEPWIRIHDLRRVDARALLKDMEKATGKVGPGRGKA